MWGLLVSTLTTSAVDSLNPIAITQQFVLQGLVKKRSHIWFFILPTGITNMVFGVLVYYGVAAFIADFWQVILQKTGDALFIAELALGLCAVATALLLLVRLTVKTMRQKTVYNKDKNNNINNKDTDSGSEDSEAKARKKIKSVSPVALMALGVGTTASELTSALPYFAFLGILLSYQVTFLQLMLLLVFYNIIYMLPFMVLYIIYVKSQDKFEKIYTVIKIQVSKWSKVALPVLLAAIGGFLIYHSLQFLL